MEKSMVLKSKESPVGWLVLNRPEKLNALTGNMREELLQGILDFSQDSTLRVLILTGSGRGFCAGSDREDLGRLKKSGDLQSLETRLELGLQITEAIQNCPKPVIAGINGAAAGAGLALAMACDLRLAQESAKFSLAYSRLGLAPDWGASYTLPRLVGESRALELTWTARPFSAQEALEMGLVHEIHTRGDFDARLRQLANFLAEQSPTALAESKRLILGSTRRSWEEQRGLEKKAQLTCFAASDHHS